MSGDWRKAWSGPLEDGPPPIVKRGRGRPPKDPWDAAFKEACRLDRERAPGRWSKAIEEARIKDRDDARMATLAAARHSRQTYRRGIVRKALDDLDRLGKLGDGRSVREVAQALHDDAALWRWHTRRVFDWSDGRPTVETLRKDIATVRRDLGSHQTR